ncbi:NPCBM/NEW2 domain-containing protein [Deinococcus sp. D7000]|nr:NPCBM/NEW2 domain-containing protein [Deinococcus sp. D7000]
MTPFQPGSSRPPSRLPTGTGTPQRQHGWRLRIRGASFPWTYTAPAGSLGPQRLTAALNTLSFETLLGASNGWGPIEPDRSNGEQARGDGRPLTLAGVPYARGFGTHAGSEMRFSLQGYNGARCTRLTSDIGVDDEVGHRGSVVFQVFLDRVLAYDSGTMTGASATRRIDLDLRGKSELRLVVGDAGDGIDYDHADWANPQVRCENDSAADLRYAFEFPAVLNARYGEQVTGTLRVSDEPGHTSGPVSFQLSVFHWSSPGAPPAQLAEPNRVYAATTLPAEFPVRLNLTAPYPDGFTPPTGPVELTLAARLEDRGFFQRAYLNWNVLP